MNEYIIRRATPDDIHKILILLDKYLRVTEQGKHAKMSWTASAQTLSYSIAASNIDVIIAECEEEIVGLAIHSALQGWFDRPDGSVEMFYVAEEHQGTGLSNQLAAVMDQCGVAKGCQFDYAYADSGISEHNTNAYVNMFKKLGYSAFSKGVMKVRK